jgi:hypothetical protein
MFLSLSFLLAEAAVIHLCICTYTRGWRCQSLGLITLKTHGGNQRRGYLGTYCSNLRNHTQTTVSTQGEYTTIPPKQAKNKKKKKNYEGGRRSYESPLSNRSSAILSLWLDRDRASSCNEGFESGLLVTSRSADHGRRAGSRALPEGSRLCNLARRVSCSSTLIYERDCVWGGWPLAISARTWHDFKD